jgi:L-cysteate sulfo-lyase
MAGTKRRDSTPDRITLGSWPTPLEAAPRLAESIGMDPDCLWIKRDDLTGLGAGGNKVRKLEYTCAAALQHRATTLVTSGATQSNHARLTAAAAARLGLECVLVLMGDAPANATARGNLALDGLLGAMVVWAGSVDDQGLDRRVTKEAAELTDRGRRVEAIPYGGSNVLGARGYLDAGIELETQLPDLRHVVVAVGSGGTMAGLVAALGSPRVLGVDVGAVPDPERRILGMVEGLAAEETTLTAPSVQSPLRLRRDQIGDGYGILTPGARQALLDAARWEGVFLDPVYTAKALSGLIAAVEDGSIGPDEPTVLLHSGGLPGLFAHSLMDDPAAFPARDPT